MSVARTVWIDLPVEVASRLQRFAAAQAQDQMRVFSEMSTPDGTGLGNPLMRQATFLQQSSLAWGTEMLEIMELCQEKLLNTGRAPSDAPIHYPKAAA
ncbi:hypothetical protein ABLE91_06475 [Aquabacter sp. CN5-332]|uniref:hypothetical protein n=1 Tax=Aquabacter sp. CN5-332 TaxID=3156608 RepID=UPI0032B4353D